MSQDLGNMEELREAVIGFASEHISAVIDEVGGSSGGANIAAALGNAWTSLKESNYEPLQTTSEELRLGCWQKLNGEGWPNVGWREAYIFGLIFLSLSLVRQHRIDPSSPTTRDILQAAMTHLDMSLIMGGASCEIVHTLIAIVEPALLRLNPPSAIDDDADAESWIVSSEPPPWAPAINPDLAIRREENLSPARSAPAAAARRRPASAPPARARAATAPAPASPHAHPRARRPRAGSRRSSSRRTRPSSSAARPTGGRPCGGGRTCASSRAPAATAPSPSRSAASAAAASRSSLKRGRD